MPPFLTQSSVYSFKLPLLHCKRNGRKFRPTLAKKLNTSEKSEAKEPKFSLKLSKSFLSKSAIVIFGLGFLDAGYSGDWSRIGVISTETEELLKIAAYLVLPLCLVLVSLISDKGKAQS